MLRKSWLCWRCSRQINKLPIWKWFKNLKKLSYLLLPFPWVCLEAKISTSVKPLDLGSWRCKKIISWVSHYQPLTPTGVRALQRWSPACAHLNERKRGLCVKTRPSNILRSQQAGRVKTLNLWWRDNQHPGLLASQLGGPWLLLSKWRKAAWAVLKF